MSDMSISALLTGRGNNTLKDKNVLKVAGRPLLQYPALEAKKVDGINRFWVSSDCPKILAAAADVGYEPIVRPAELARPDAQHVDAIDHALGIMKQAGDDPDILVVLLANTVTVKAEWIRNCINRLLEEPARTACVPVYRVMDHHPLRAKKLDARGELVPFIDSGRKPVSTNRQDLEPCYFLCHNFWVLNLRTIDRKTGLPPWTFMGDRVMPYEVEGAFDVHDEQDLARSETWLREQGLLEAQ